MGIARRDAFAAGVGLAFGGVAGAGGYFGAKLLDGERDAVTGFLWSDDEFEPFENTDLRNSSPGFEGDRNVSRFSRYDNSPTVAVVGTLATEIMAGFNEGPSKRLGIAYTDPGGKWHQGYGLPGQIFGGMIPGKDGPVVAATLGIGPEDVEFSWVMRGENGLVTPLRTLAIGGTAIAREDAAGQYPGVPQL